MLAKLARSLPDGDDWLFEPKWDGFRCIVFRDGDSIELGSRNERPLTRYFPEVCSALLSQLPARCVMDGEIVIAGPSGLDFDALQLRLHPAESRVRRLAGEIPASFIAFDLLALGSDDLRARPFVERRALLSSAMAAVEPPVYLTPASTDRAVAEDWFTRFEGAGLDGVVAKRLDLPYRADERVMIKVKHERTADCVVAGFRWHKSGPIVGSLLLGLFDSESPPTLHHVGVTSSFTQKRRAELVEELAPYRLAPEDAVAAGHPWAQWAVAEAHTEGKRLPGGVSRWNAKKDLSFELLRPTLVCEVAYGQLQSGRLRHGATFRRWRPDRDPSSCTYAQLETVVPAELSVLFGSTTA